MNTRPLGKIVLGLLMLGMGLSCATYVPIKSVRKPTIDTTGIQRLAIRPFENASGVDGPDTAQLTRYLTEAATAIITRTGKFTIVAPTDPNADGVFAGELTLIAAKDSEAVQEKKNKNGNPYTEVTYRRDLTLEFSYSIISTRTDMTIGKVLKKGTSGVSSVGSPAGLSDTLTLAKAIVNAELRGLERDIVPTIESEQRALMDETSSDPVVTQKMDTALALVKSGNYQEAALQYEAVYREHGSLAAKTNAELVRQSLASDTAARAKLAELYNDKDGLLEKAVKQAAAVLTERLPAGAALSIMKTSGLEQTMIDYAMEQLTKALVQVHGITVSDRSNQALLSAEQQFQLSGAVSDESAVSIGKQLGVTYLVLCWISGEKSGRRLNIRVLDIETALIVYQYDVEI
ncbi:hypothetical protein ACYULU_11590 [Breznakiellaceae bacterium SP9]